MAKTSYTVDGARVGQARVALDLTQVDLADALGINRVTLNKIENGKRNISLDLLERMTRCLCRSREWLLGEPEIVDEIEASKAKVADALAKISAGFEDLAEVLNARVREVRDSDPAQSDRESVLA